MFTLDVARAQIRDLQRKADDHRRILDADRPRRRRRGTRRA